MTGTYFNSLTALHKLRPLLCNPLHEALLSAISMQGNPLGVRNLVESMARHVSLMPGPGQLGNETPQYALRFLFTADDSRVIYLSERPVPHSPGSAVTFFSVAKDGFFSERKSAPISEIISSGALLDLTHNPSIVPDSIRKDSISLSNF